MFEIYQKLSVQRSTSTSNTAHTNLVGWQGQNALAENAITRAQFVQKVAHWKLIFKQITQDKIALYLSDSIEFTAALFAAWHAGKTVYLSADVLENNCRNLAQEVAIFIGEFPESYATALPQPTIESATDNIDNVVTNAEFETCLPHLDSHFPALVVYTSGSTGEAQAISKQWSQLATEIETLELLFGEKLGDASIYSTVSHHHIYGLLFKVLWPFASGRPVFAQALNFPEQLQQHLSTHACALIASPAHLKRLPSHLDWSSVASQLCAVFSSGGPLPNDALEHVQALWQQTPLEVYGSSETGGIAWRQRLRSQHAAWTVFPKIKWRMSEENHLLEIQSPHLADDDWYQLADQIETIDAQHFQLLGRQDRIVKIEEKRISLDLMEKALLANDLVQEVRLMLNAGHTNHTDEAATNNQRQHIYAFIVLSEQGKTYLQYHSKFALNQTLRSVLSPLVEAVALPRRWRYLDALPVNAQGKTTQAQLLALLAGNENSPMASSLQPVTKPHWRLLEQEPERLLFEIIVPQDLLYFKGHFQIAPVLPGVVQVDWAIYFARQYFNLPANFSGLHALKFQQIISPETPVHLELLHQVQKQALQFRYYSDAGPHATGRVLFESNELQ